MAEKRVSVRLVAEGGRQVRAELEGIGDAGARGFGRLSTEMEQANTRLAGFARKAGIALAAVTVAAAAAAVAMVRSGLEIIGAQADMAASLKTTVESLQVLTWAGEMAGVSMGEIEQATKKLTTRLSEAAAGSGSAVGALKRLNLSAAGLQALPLDQRIVAIQEALNRFVPEAERAAVASDLFGDKAALAFLRIDPTTLREAAQDVRDFGVAVSASDATQIERTGAGAIVVGTERTGSCGIGRTQGRNPDHATPETAGLHTELHEGLMDLERMQALLTALQEARFAGLRSVSYDGKTVTYGSDAELAAAIRDLEGRIATASATPRRRRWGTVATKGL